MMIIRRLLAAALVLVALVGCLILSGYRPLAEHTLNNGREIDRQFRAANSAILQFETSRGRRASEGEISELISRAAGGRYHIELTADSSICDRSSAAFGSLRKSRYVLWTWRGEWAECFSPESGASTVVTTQRQLAMLGSVVGDEVALGVFVALSLGSAAWLWRRPGRSKMVLPPT